VPVPPTLDGESVNREPPCRWAPLFRRGTQFEEGTSHPSALPAIDDAGEFDDENDSKSLTIIDWTTLPSRS
jgi:hypothetical protein